MPRYQKRTIPPPQLNKTKTPTTVANKKQKKSNDEQQQQLIEERLSAAAAANNNDGDDDNSSSTGSRSDSLESNEEEDKTPKATLPKTPRTPKTKTTSPSTRSSLRIIAKMKQTAKMFPPRSNLELQTNATTTVAFPDGKEKIVVMTRAHSMFMNCVPLTKQQLGVDVLEKVHSTVRNTLFKSAKFYPKPNHADAVVGLCLYNCDFRLPGMEGDFARAKVWDAVRNEIIFQTGIIRQQVVPQWHAIARGK